MHSHGVDTARAVRVFKTYGADAMPKNPYRLAGDIRGIGFKTADTIAMKLGMEKTAMVRVQSGISYALTEAITREMGFRPMNWYRLPRGWLR